MSYCLKCKTVTKNNNTINEVLSYKTKTGKNVHKNITKSKCASCGSFKTKFVKGGNIDIHAIIGKLPKPKGGWVLPNHKYTGPYNPLDKQLDDNDKPIPGQEPYNQVDAIAMKHDICYRDNENNKHGCDRKMLDNLDSMKPTGLRERVDRAFVKGVIGTKLKLGLGSKNSQRRLVNN